MTKSNRLGIYADVRAVLDAALEAGGGTFTATDHGAAVHWRQRAYRFRKAYAETLGPQAMSPYDTLVLPRLVDGSSEVVIQVRRVGGTFTPASVPVNDDALMAEAEALAKRVGL